VAAVDDFVDDSRVVDELLEAETCRSWILAKELEDTANGKELRRPRLAGDGSVAAPDPVPGLPAESCADWVERQVARELEQVPVAVDGRRIEPPLEEVTVDGMAVIEGLRVPAVEPMHSGGEIGLGCLEDKVVVIRHEAVAVPAPPSVPRELAEES
jgi:hypothetical protein